HLLPLEPITRAHGRRELGTELSSALARRSPDSHAPCVAVPQALDQAVGRRGIPGHACFSWRLYFVPGKEDFLIATKRRCEYGSGCSVRLAETVLQAVLSRDADAGELLEPCSSESQLATSLSERRLVLSYGDGSLACHMASVPTEEKPRRL